MTTVPLASQVVERARERRWQRRPWLRRLLEGIAIVGPFLVAIGLAWMLTSVTPSPDGIVLAIARWVGIAGLSSMVLLAGERAARRILPVASLFDLTLLFPDRAPSRFKVALRTGTTRQLERRIEELKADAVADPSIGSAQRLLELAAALNVHDRITRGHAERVRAYTQMIAAEMGLEGAELDRVRWAGLLHDIGKLFIPTEILNKTTALTDDEYRIIQQHPDMGRDMIEDLVPWLGDAARAVWEHHEKWDGTGYPRGLRGDEISLAGRIVAVADVYDVITSARSYKDPLPPKEARAELARCAGTHFDPAVVRAFMNVSLGRLNRASGPLAWLTQLPLFPTAVLTSAQAAGSAAVLTGALGASSAGIGTDLLGDVFDFLDPRSPATAFATGPDGEPIDPADDPSTVVIVTTTAGTTSPAASVTGDAEPAETTGTTPGSNSTGSPPAAVGVTSPPTPTGTTEPASSPTTTIPGSSTTTPSLTTLPTTTTPPTLPTTTIPTVTTLPELTVPTTLPELTVPTTLPELTVPTTLPALPTTLPPLPTTLPDLTVPDPTVPTTLPDLPGLP